MRSIIGIRRPSASMIVALVALFAALGGTGYAAVTFNGRDIQKHSVPANRIVNNALGGGQIDESKLGPVPTAQQALTAQTAASATHAAQADNADNATNATNAQNAQQLQGRDATRFLANSVQVHTAQLSVSSGASGSVKASCAAGEKGIGGGAAWMIPSSDVPTGLDAQLNSSYPLPASGGTAEITGWHAVGYNRVGALRDLRAYVICVPRTA